MSMHGLIGARFLKRFAGRILRRPRPILTDMTGSKPDHDKEMSRRSDGPEKATRGKEEPGNIEKTDEITNRSTRMVDQIGHQASLNGPMAIVRKSNERKNKM